MIFTQSIQFTVFFKKYIHQVMQPSPESNLRIFPSSLKEILYSLAATHHFLILSPPSLINH